MQTFGKFQLLERIGTGGMAEIFLAKPLDASMSKLVAVKRILPHLMDDPTFHEMFRRECAIVLRFRHHSIIAVHEMGTIEGQHYMSMEYFPGKTLGTLMVSLRKHEKNLDTDLKVQIIKNIAEALQYIHDFSDYGRPTEIIHRDISPHNIMIGFDGATKLIDFGIAKITDRDHTQTKAIKGKVPYMSPEQVRSEKLTKQTDIFSLGVVFWELLAGRKLFTGQTIAELTTKVEECIVPPISIEAPNIPAEIGRICTKALSRETKFRYSSATEMIADIDEYLRSQNAENPQRKLATIVQELFTEELEVLKRQLHSYEFAFEEKTHVVNSLDTSVTPLQQTRPVIQKRALPAADLSSPLVKNKVQKNHASSKLTQSEISKRTSKKSNSSYKSYWPVLAVLGFIFLFQNQVVQLTLKLKDSVVRMQDFKSSDKPVPMASPIVKAVVPEKNKTNVQLRPTPAPSIVAQSLPVPVPSPRVEAPQRNVAPPPVAPPVRAESKPLEAVKNISPKAPQPLAIKETLKKPEKKASRPEPAKDKLVVKLIPKKSSTASKKRARKEMKEVATKAAQKSLETAQVKARAATEEELPIVVLPAVPETPEREPANAPPPTPAKAEAFAFITVLSDPGARILINGKMAGEEIINERRVPAGEVTITVIDESGKTTTKKMTFLPLSRNIVEISTRD